MLKSPQLDIPEKHTVQNTRLNAVVRYWNKRRGDNVMPSRIQIDPIDIPRLLPIVFIAQIVGTDVRFRLVGSETTAAYGTEMRGRSIREIEFGAFTPAWIEAFERVTGDRAPSFVSGFFTAGLQNCRIETALLPLSDGNGNLSHIFGGAVIKPVPRDLAIQPREQKIYITRLDGNRNLPEGCLG